MRRLKEYLERNNYNIVKSLMDVLNVDEMAAKKFYDSLSLFDEAKVIDSLKEPVSEPDIEYVSGLYNNAPKSTEDEIGTEYTSKYEDGKYNIFDPSGKMIDTVYSGHEAHNVLYWYNNKAKQVDEEQINELSPRTLKNYIKTASNDAAYNAEKYGAFGHDEYANLEKRRHTGIEKALDKLSPDEVEESKKVDAGRLASKAAVGGYDMARELSKGQYQPRAEPNKKFKDQRQKNKADLKRGVYERRVTPVLESEQGILKFKIVESNTISANQVVLESSVVLQPIGGLTSINGLGMNSLRKMSGIAEQNADQVEDDITELNELSTPNMEGVMATIANLDDDTRSILLSILAMNSAKKPAMNAEQMLAVKESIREFGLALQCWIEDSCGALDFLCPLVEAMWVKYNEFCI